MMKRMTWLIILILTLCLMTAPALANPWGLTGELYALLDSLKRELNLTMIISTHDWDYVRDYADSVLELGRSVEFIGPAADWIARKGGGANE